ncbi:DUF3025 domain-containing protein [Oxalicibacterium faecigallinarum]|nr:DUF3025 domain-containing protein [Oxalicibacterium faecigallinarum]
MTSSCLAQIDWSRPWLASVRPTGEALAQSANWRHACNARMQAMALRNHRGLMLQCVPQEALPQGMAYEQFISDTGNIPTRDNLHDFFNALVWLHYPKIKVQLNRLQAQEIARAGPDAPRGSVRDAATIFDENAVLLVTDKPIFIDALRAHAWQQLFVKARADFEQHCHPLLFGHALMEKLVAPRKPITGHIWFVALPASASAGEIDAYVAAQLARGLSTADFSPLPVLGVPGWWPEQNEDFYADVSVFRPKRSERR